MSPVLYDRRPCRFERNAATAIEFVGSKRTVGDRGLDLDFAQAYA
jgi:hypothetical protein